MIKINMPETDLFIEEERLASLLKVYRGSEDNHFAQAYIQTGVMGEAVIKGLTSPIMSYRQRKELNDAVYAYIANMGYTTTVMQRARYANGVRSVTTVRKKKRSV